MDLFVASSNPGKLRDFAQAAAARPEIHLAPLPGLAAMPVPEETAASFEGNARIKALAYAALAPGCFVLADDSGIAVPALGGAPGVRSARYAADCGFPNPAGLPVDAWNTACLLAHTAHLSAPAAAYECVLAVARDGEIIATAHGSVEGTLLSQPRGSGGFGYDPLFLLPHLGLSMAEIDPETRLSFSHRSRALAQLLPRLR